MDPLSVSASIVAVLQLTTTVIQYMSHVKDGSDDRSRIRSELCGINGILSILNGKAVEEQQGDAWSMTFQSLCVVNGPLQQFEQTLQRLAKKLRVPSNSRKLFSAIDWPFKQDEVTELLTSLERQKSLFLFAQQNDHMALSRAIKDDVAVTSQKVEKMGLEFAQVQIGELRERIHRWLDPPDPSTNYNKALKARFADTGSWFTQSDTFTRWKTTPGSFLWLHGIPGCGKSVLSSSIIETGSGHCSGDPLLAMIYFYFDFNNIAKQRPENMIRSFIVQLSSCSQSTPAPLNSLYDRCLNGGSQPSYDSLLTTLRQMMAGYTETYIVIDALDECSENRPDLLVTIEEMVSWEEQRLHTLITSRREKDIEDSFAPLLGTEDIVLIRNSSVDEDIRAYTHGRLQKDAKLRKWRCHPIVQEEIESTLTAKANGMFRWAACQLDSLGNCMNVSGLRKALASLPKTLDDTYARILCYIDDDHHSYACKILNWLTFSLRPLSLDEVAETIAIDVQGDPRFDVNSRLAEPLDILSICAGLISLESLVLERKDQLIVQLAHFSVKEYLISSRIMEGQAKRYSIREHAANVRIANDCLVYLLEMPEIHNLVDAVDDIYERNDGSQVAAPSALYATRHRECKAQLYDAMPLAMYAAKYWFHHARIAGKDSSSVTDLAMELCEKQQSFVNWLRLYNPPLRTFFENSLTPFGPLDIRAPIHYAARAGLADLTRGLLDSGADGNVLDEQDGNLYSTRPLQAAIASPLEVSEPSLKVTEREKLNVVQVLLERGADINAEGGKCNSASTALQEASIGGFDEIVRTLLESGADPNAPCRRHDSASKSDHDAPCSYHDTALRLASEGGHHQIVGMLADKGAHLEFYVRNKGTALRTAAKYGHSQVIEKLLDNGVIIDAESGIALRSASSKGHLKTVAMLLDKGANINAVGSSGPALTPALIHASHYGHEDVALMLLQRGADPNLAVEGGLGGWSSVLGNASSRGWVRTISLALAEGAHVNAVCGPNGENALEIALGSLYRAEDGPYHEIVQILLTAGAYTNDEDLSALIPEGSKQIHESDGAGEKLGSVLSSRPMSFSPDSDIEPAVSL